MLYNAEGFLYTTIGKFSTTVQYIQPGQFNVDEYRGLFNNNFPGQCAAFIVSNNEFIWFIEQWDVENSLAATLQNKKVYPAKVTGINLPLFGQGSQTFKWRDGLICHENIDSFQSWNYLLQAFRPGFGQTISPDLNRPVKSVTIEKNNLGLGNFTSSNLAGPLGRLMSMAFWVDPDLAKQYDDSKSKKKKKSLNEQDYQQMPEYPPYTPYQDNSGY